MVIVYVFGSLSGCAKFRTGFDVFCSPRASGVGDRDCGSGLARRITNFRLTTMAEPTDSPASFEAALEELEAIVAKMEAGTLPLADSLEAYRRGAVLLQFCQRTLDDAQQQVEVLEKGVLKAFEAPVRTGGNDDDER